MVAKGVHNIHNSRPSCEEDYHIMIISTNCNATLATECFLLFMFFKGGGTRTEVKGNSKPLKANGTIFVFAEFKYDNFFLQICTIEFSQNSVMNRQIKLHKLQEPQ